MSNDVRERVRTLILSLSPALEGTRCTLVISRNDENTRVHASTDIHKSDEAKEYIAALYKERYQQEISRTLCTEVLREVKRSLLIDRLASQQHTSHEQVSPVIEAAYISYLPEFEDTPIPNVYLHRASNKVYQLDRHTHLYKPIAQWTIPVVHNRYAVTDSHGKTTYEYDLTINGHRQTIERAEIDNGRYTKYFDIPNVSSRWLADTYKTLVISEAQKIEVTIKEKTIGLYEYAESPYVGFMLPTSQLLLSDGSYYKSCTLTRSLPAKDIEVWSRYQDSIPTTTEDDIREVYDFMKHITPSGIALILLANNARALCHSLSTDTFKCGHVLYLYGEQGSGKTNVALLARGIAQPYRGEQVTPIDATFRGTNASVEDAIDFYRDTPVVIDDLVQNEHESDSILNYKQRIVESIARSSFDGNAIRERMTQTMSKQTSRYAHTLPVITGERYLHHLTLSAHRRILSIQVTNKDIHRKSVESNSSYALDKAIPYAHTLYVWGHKIKLWLVQRIKDDKKALLEELSEKFTRYQQEVSKGIREAWSQSQNIELPYYVDSLIDIVSNILIGAYILDSAAHFETTCTDDIITPLVHALYVQLCRMANVPTSAEDETPLQVALREMYEGLGTGETYKIDGETVKPIIYDFSANDAPTITYTGKEISKSQWGIEYASHPHHKVIGYVNTSTNYVYLLQSALEIVAALIAKSTDDKTVSASKVRKMLVDEGIAVEDRDGRNIRYQCKRNGIRLTVLRIPLEKFLSLVERELSEDIEEVSTDMQLPENVVNLAARTRLITDVDNILANTDKSLL